MIKTKQSKAVSTRETRARKWRARLLKRIDVFNARSSTKLMADLRINEPGFIAVKIAFQEPGLDPTPWEYITVKALNRLLKVLESDNSVSPKDLTIYGHTVVDWGDSDTRPKPWGTRNTPAAQEWARRHPNVYQNIVEAGPAGISWRKAVQQ